MLDSQPVIASTWRRIGGGLCDLLLIEGIFVITSLNGWGNIAIGDTGFHFSINGPHAYTILLSLVSLMALMEYKTGKTPGKYFFCTKVLGENYQKISITQAFIRNVIRLIDNNIIGLIIIICTKENQRLGDLVAKTYVVED